MNLRSGSLIVLEGPDGVGKSTLAQLLSSLFQREGIPAESVAFPGKTQGKLGELVYRLHHNPGSLDINGITATALQAMHLAAHLDLIETFILPKLCTGTTVLLDRYWWSTWVYGRHSTVRADILDCLIDAENCAWDGVRPTLAILLDRESPYKPEARRDWEQLRTLYRQVADRESQKYRVCIVPNDRTIDHLLETVWTLIDK